MSSFFMGVSLARRSGRRWTERHQFPVSAIHSVMESIKSLVGKWNATEFRGLHPGSAVLERASADIVDGMLEVDAVFLESPQLDEVAARLEIAGFCGRTAREEFANVLSLRRQPFCGGSPAL